MKSIGFIIGYLFLITLTYGQPLVTVDANDTTSGGIIFERGLNWHQLLAKAKSENKLVFVDLFASWCGPCKMMDRDTYSDQMVSETMNAKFISVKIQADSTGRDDVLIRKWYADAGRLVKDYHITGYPSFLFFNSEGQLVDKDLGYRKPKEFISLVEEAERFGKLSYDQCLQAYQREIKDYPRMDQLALFVKKVVGKKDLATSIARDCIENYLDKLPRQELCTKARFDFINEFPAAISSSDSIFALCYKVPDTVDKAINYKGWSKWIVTGTIVREELTNKCLKDDHPIDGSPGWSSAAMAISKKYPKLDSRLMVLDFQIWYYRIADCNWKLWAKYMNDKINLYPAKANQGLSVYMQLNMTAWDAFLHCDDKAVLEEALKWSDLSIKLETNVQYLDTRANLLYKLGHVKEAIEQEGSAIEMSQNIVKASGKAKGLDIDDFLSTKRKMLANQPTWSTK